MSSLRNLQIDRHNVQPLQKSNVFRHNYTIDQFYLYKSIEILTVLISKVKNVPDYTANGESANLENVRQQNGKSNTSLYSKTTPLNGSSSVSRSTSNNKNASLLKGGSSTVSTKQPASTQQPPRSKVSIRDQSTFSWHEVGTWDSDQTSDKLASLSIINKIESYIVNHFYGDWYWNTSIIIGTCFFSWAAARIGGGILSLLFVLLFTNSVYRLEFRRFNRDIRDDMQRVSASNRLEKEVETMEWLNSFLDKFWVIYMPALSEQVMFQANEVLKDAAPGFGIEALSLDEFTLGSKAPRVDSIKSYTKKGQDHIEMDWAFSFAPNDTDDMTKNEIKKKINPKVALGVTVGKAFISKSLPILVEDMAFTGRMNIKLKLTQNFPHVKMVSIQFLEAPTIDYALKPVGGDTLGLDIMSFIPGLSTFVNGLIHSTLRPMLYAPNSLDIDVEEIMAQQSNDSIGVAAITVKRLTNLKSGSDTKPNSINPYVQILVSNNGDIDEKTKTKKQINDPVFLETKYILLNALDGNHLTFNIFDLKEDKAEDFLIGNIDFPLGDLLQKDTQLGLVKNIVEGGKTVGKIEFDIRWFPTLEPQVLDDGTKEETTDSEVGIMKLNLHGAKDLELRDSVVGLLNPYAEIYINQELVKTTRRLKQKNEPEWEKAFESIVTQQSETQIQVLVKDSVDDNVIGKLDANLQDLIFETSRGQEYIKTPPVKEGGPHTIFRISAGWKALGMTDDKVVNTHYNSSIGGLRLHLRSATDLVNLESVGKVDPYVRILLNGKLRAKTTTIAETLDPNFNNVYFFSIANEHQHLLLEIMDEEADGKDRSLGSAAINVNEFLKKNKDGYFLGYDGSNEVIEQPVLFNGATHGYLTYSVSFVPTIPVYTLSQIQNKGAYIEELNKKEKEDEERSKREHRLAEEHPNDYEWVDVAEDTIPDPPKIELPLEKSIKYRTGNVVVHVLAGKFDKPDYRVHTLFDDHAYPSGVSPRADGKNLHISSTSEGFIRDLPNSKLIFRLSQKSEIVDEKEISHERIFDTIEILKRAYYKPIELKINEKNILKVQLEFIPSAVKLAPLDTILDVGHLKLDIIGAQGIPAADKNGKSDPLLVIKVDGVEIYKTDKKRKTLDPVWNEAVDFPLLSRSRQILLLEVYDWDLTHDDRLLGAVNLDISTIEPLNSTQFSVKLNTEGIINLRATFKPDYVRPKLNSKSGLPIDLGSVAGAPMKVVGGAAGLAGDVVGGGFGAASDGVTKGGQFLKGFGKSKSKKLKSSSPVEGKSTNGSAHDNESAYDENMSRASSDSYSQNGSSNRHENGAAATNGEDAATSRSPYANEMQSLRSGKPPSVQAAPNMNTELLPAPQRPNVGHQRILSQGSDVESSFAGSINGPDAIPGRITIVSASGFSNSSLEVKVVLKTSTKEKSLHKTRAAKLDKSDSAFKWNETVPFQCTSDGVLQFFIKEHHRLGKSVDIGVGTLSVGDYINTDQVIDIPLEGGSIAVHLRYFTTRDI